MPTWRAWEEVGSLIYGRECSDTWQVSGRLRNIEIANESLFWEATALEGTLEWHGAAGGGGGWERAVLVRRP